MKEFMEKRQRGFVPRARANSAPGAGGIFWYYNRGEDGTEEGNEENDLENNEVADSLMKTIAFEGRNHWN